MKRKKLLRVMGCLLAIAMLAGIMVATVSADSPEIAFLNPLGEVEPVQNQPLVARLADLNGSRIRLLQYGAANSASQLAMASLQATLNAAGATALAPADFGGTVFDARTAAQYTTWATGVDAVVIGVVEDNLAAWWIGNHAKEIEARGVPVVVLTTDWFYSAVRAGAQDNGLAEMRIVSIPRAPWADAQGYAITGTPTPRRTYIDNNIVGGTVNIGTAVKAALTDPLTVAELSAAPLTVEDMGIPYADGRATISVPGANAVEALPAFYELSMDLGFGDGMPLMIPTQEAVDAMIAGQGADGREADEVLGKVMLRGGIMTVEKIAANAVMAGARPQHFSTILAVMEAYATGWEDNKLFYREIMSIDQRTLVMIVSGPIVGTGAGQLDLSRGRMLDPGKDDSAVIGRAVMLAIRNIGHIAFERSAVIGAGSRLKPHELFVMAEASEYLPAGWVTLSEHMGFGANSNTVTLLSVNQTRFNGDVGGTAAGGYGGTFDNIGGAYRTQGTATNLFNSPGIFVVHWRDANYAASTDTRPRQDGGLSTAARGISSKSMLQQFIVGTGGSVTENGPSPTTNIVRNQAREALVWPIVAGYGHSTTTRVFHAASADYNNSRGFQTQRIGGQSSPSAPLNAKAKVSADGTKAWLKWDAPARLGGGTITGYEISCNDGKTWEDVGLVNEFTVTGLKYAPSDQHRIWVRAKTDVLNSTDVRAPGVDGPNAHLDWRASGRGAWASADVKIEIIGVKIDGPSMLSVQRNKQYTITLDISPAHALANEIVWTVSDPTFAIVKDGVVTVLNKMGTAVLTAKDPESGITHSIVLRIT